MSSKTRSFTNPFAIPSKKAPPSKSTTPSISSNHQKNQKASKSLETFLNFNPTLLKPIQPTTNQSVYHQHYNQNSRKRPFSAATRISNSPFYNHNNYNNYNHHNNGHHYYSNNNNNHNTNHGIPPRKKRRKYPNDAGLTDAQMEKILEARKKQEASEVDRYLEERKRNFPTRSNVEKKREIIAVKKRRGQTLSIHEKIMNFSDRTGNKKTPSSLRFLDTPRFSENIVRRVLKKEIDQEYSAILQCFRYLIKTDFLTKELDPNQMIDDQDEDMSARMNNGNQSKDSVFARDYVEDQDHDEDMNEMDGNHGINGIPKDLPFDMRDIERDEALLDYDDEEEEDDDVLDFAFNEILAQQSTNQVKCAVTNSSGGKVSR